MSHAMRSREGLPLAAPAMGGRISGPMIVDRTKGMGSVERAANRIRAACSLSPRLGIVLGTGLSPLAGALDGVEAIAYGDIPDFPRATALAHRGRLLLGRLGGLPVIAMDGRCHIYEGYSPAALMLPIRVMAHLGIRALVVSNASGGLNPRFRTGDVMVIESHINLLWQRSPLGVPVAAGRQVRTCEQPYTAELRELALEVARRHNFVAHPGVYIAVPGPNYETRAEYRMFRRLGGDAVGMSTVPEVIAAAENRIPTLALSMITNVARPDAPEQVDAGAVIEAARRCAPNMQRIVEAVVRELQMSPYDS